MYLIVYVSHSRVLCLNYIFLVDQGTHCRRCSLFTLLYFRINVLVVFILYKYLFKLVFSSSSDVTFVIS